MKRLPRLAMLISLFFVLSCDGSTVSSNQCGDNIIDPGEECDGTELPYYTCEEIGYYRQSGNIKCTSDCTIDISACEMQCGDAQIQQEYGEDCEGADLNGESCESLGYYGGELACNVDACTYDLPT